MKQYFVLLMMLIGIAASRAEDDLSTVETLNTAFARVQREVCPTNGMSEGEVTAKWGRPRGATTPDIEKANGDYDKDRLGLYRWFYETQLSWKEEGTGLSVGNRVEMIIYFVEGKTVGSHIKLPYSRSGQTFVTSNGVVRTFSGQPPVLRKKADGTVWDFHQDEGELEFYRQLITTLNAYREYWQSKWEKQAEQSAAPLPSAPAGPSDGAR